MVSAPAGWGKTTLVRELASRTPMPMALSQVEPGCREPSRFLRLLARSLRACEPGAFSPASAASAATPPEKVLPVLVGCAAKLARPVVLTIEDYHHVAGGAIHRWTVELVESLPPSVRVLLTTRAQPELPVAAWRAQGRLAEVGMRDLAFSLDEASTFLRTTMGLELGVRDVERLHARTEGWAAGLQLAGLALRDGSDVASVVSGFDGEHRFVFDYLTEQVLKGQTAARRRALLQLSILERLSQDLVRAVVGEGAEAPSLEALERANLFLLSLDPSRRWYRFHHLFAAFLRSQLEREADAAERARLHVRASAWFAANGEVEEAVRHALAAREPERAADVLEAAAAELSSRSEDHSTLEYLLSLLPDDCVRARPLLCVEAAWNHFLAGDPAPIAELLESALAAAERTQEVTRRDVVGRVAAIRAMLASVQGHLEPAKSFGRKALRNLSSRSLQWRATANLALGTAELVRGEVGSAARHLKRAERQCLAYDDVAKRIFAVGFQARTRRRLGRLGAAEAEWKRGIQLSEPLAGHRGTFLTAPGGFCHSGLAELHYERDERDAARREALRALQLAAHWATDGLPEAMAAANLVLARLQQIRGGETRARRFLERAERSLDDSRFGDYRSHLAATRVRLWLALGDIGAAKAWARRLGREPTPLPDGGVDPDTAIALLRVELASREPRTSGRRAAAEAIEAWRREAESRGWGEALIELLAMGALAAQAEGELDHAQELLRDALVRAAHEGYVRVFADEGTPMAQLLVRVVNGLRRRHRGVEAVPPPYLARVMRSLGLAPSPDRETVPRPAASPPFGALTPRELEVLALLAKELSKSEIGDRLHVSLGTVKRHVSNICGKLGVQGRSRAVATARRLRLV